VIHAISLKDNRLSSNNQFYAGGNGTKISPIITVVKFYSNHLSK